MDYQVLVIDAAEDRMTQIVSGIQACGFPVRGVASANLAVGMVAHDQPACILLGDLPLDWTRSAYCRVLRRILPDSDTRILSISPPEEDGADVLRDRLVDDMLPPIQNPNSLAEIAVTLMTPHAMQGATMRCGGFSLDTRQRRLSGFGVTLNLNPQIAAIMTFLMQEPNQVHSRDDIRRAISRDHEVKPRSVDVYVQRLRGAAKAVGMPNPIETIHTRGYRLSHH